jgi:hypothetical protein
LTQWIETKRFLEQAVAVSNESLHIFGGVLILFASATVLRKPVSNRWPWLVVLTLACLNELVDLRSPRWPHDGARFGESVKDVFVTMLVPSMLLFTARKTPSLYRRDPDLPPCPAPDDPELGAVGQGSRLAGDDVAIAAELDEPAKPEASDRVAP